MKTLYRNSIFVILGAIIITIMMCAFLVEESHAQTITKGTTTRKEQTVKVALKKGVIIITVKDKDSWVYAHLQKLGGNKKRKAIGGYCTVAPLNKASSVAIPIREAGNYHVYIHGRNKGASYTVRRFYAGGPLKSGVPRLATSYMDNKTIAYYKIEVPAKGKLRVNVNDASYHYPGYSKVKLRKAFKSGNKDITEEEHLFRSYGFGTTYGVTEGTYYIGVRSSSEVYSITATFTEYKDKRGGRKFKNARLIKIKKRMRGVITTATKKPNWYKMELPTSKKRKNVKIKLTASNNNSDIYGGIRFRVVFFNKKNKKYIKRVRNITLNNSSETIELKMRKKKNRKVYIRVMPYKGATGTYSIKYTR